MVSIVGVLGGGVGTALAQETPANDENPYVDYVGVEGDADSEALDPPEQPEPRDVEDARDGAGGAGDSEPRRRRSLDPDELREMSVSELVETARDWKVPLLIGAALLTLAFLFAAGAMKPGGLSKPTARKIDPLPWIIWLFAAMVVMLAMASGPTVTQRLPLERWELSDEQMETVRLAVSFGLASLAGLGMLLIVGKSCPEGGMKLGPLDAAVGLGCFVLAWPIIELTSVAGVKIYEQMTEGESPPVLAHPVLERIVETPGDPWTWGLIAVVVLLAPLVEELIYRVFIQTAAMKLTKSPWFSIVFTALLFAGMHRAQGGGEPVPWHALLPIAMLGVCCGVAYERTRRVGVPIAMHACFNAVNIAFALLITSPTAAEPGVAI
ncbi:MAG: CPBP family intramembrane glutamic endopeptidase [Planctomycetota bacterium]